MTNILDRASKLLDTVEPDWWDEQGAGPFYSRETVESLLSDYEEVLADHRRLVRVLDVLMHGEEGAAQQASLCDLVAMFPAWKDAHRKQVLLEAAEWFAGSRSLVFPEYELRRMAEGEK